MVQHHHAAATASASPQEESSFARPTTKILPTTAPVQVVWLGSYSVARNLNDRLGVPKSALEFVVCPLHSRVPDAECNECVWQQSTPSLPCKVYSSVALTLGAAARRAEQQADNDLDGYTIFGAQDPEFCPIVFDHSLVYAKERVKRPRKAKERANKRAMPGRSQQQEPANVAYVQIAVLCRDSKNEDWMVGRAFRRSAIGSTVREAGGASTYGQGFVGIYEVAVDERFVFAKLSQVVGAGRLRDGAKGEFYKKFMHARGGNSNEVRSGRGESGASGFVIEELFCHRQRSASS